MGDANPAGNQAGNNPADVVFALTPAEARQNILDYTQRDQMRIYDAAVAPLEGEKFDGTPGKLTNFLARLKEKANNFTWTSTICKIKITDEISRNLIDDYGNISLEKVRESAITYAGQQNRKWQNSHQMKVCIFDSLTEDFQNRVILDQKSWTVTSPAGSKYADGACLLKVVISLSYPDTQATTSHIRTELTKTDAKIKELNYDIIKFNDWTKEQLAALAARGETTTDLMVNLFKGYEAVPDKEFLVYIASKKSRYEEGKPLTTDELMELAQNKYKNKVQTKTWNTPTEEQEQIIALEARVESLQAQNRSLSKRTPTRGARQTGQAQRGQQKGRSPNKKSANQSRGDGDYLNATGKWAWLKVAPKQGDKTTKSYDGKTYFWCNKHERWGRHTTAECKKGQTQGKKQHQKKIQRFR